MNPASVPFLITVRRKPFPVTFTPGHLIVFCQFGHGENVPVQASIREVILQVTGQSYRLCLTAVTWLTGFQADLINILRWRAHSFLVVSCIRSGAGNLIVELLYGHILKLIHRIAWRLFVEAGLIIFKK